MSMEFMFYTYFFKYFIYFKVFHFLVEISQELKQVLYSKLKILKSISSPDHLQSYSNRILLTDLIQIDFDLLTIFNSNRLFKEYN